MVVPRLNLGNMVDSVVELLLVNLDKSPEVDEWYSKSGSVINNHLSIYIFARPITNNDVFSVLHAMHCHIMKHKHKLRLVTGVCYCRMGVGTCLADPAAVGPII